MQPANPTEQHPLQPFLPQNARLLMLGSFPPARKRWCMDFFYPNFTNDMWRIVGMVFFHDKAHFVDTKAKTFRQQEIISFLHQRGIAIYDTAQKVIRTRNTASDKDLQVVEQTNLHALLEQIPLCQAVVTTGQKATDLFSETFHISQPKVGSSQPFCHQQRHMLLYRMPSSSRAYPMKLEDKAAQYARMFAQIYNDIWTDNPTTVKQHPFIIE